MSLNSHSHRFDPRWLFPAIGTGGAELYGAPDASPLLRGRRIDERPDQT